MKTDYLGQVENTSISIGLGAFWELLSNIRDFYKKHELLIEVTKWKSCKYITDIL